MMFFFSFIQTEHAKALFTDSTLYTMLIRNSSKKSAKISSKIAHLHVDEITS